MDPRDGADRPAVLQVRWRDAALGLAAVAFVAQAAGGPAAMVLAALVATWLWQRAGGRAAVPGLAERPGTASPAASAPDARPTPSAEHLTLHYRPLRSLPELHLRGVEAELRWQLSGPVPRPPSDWPADLAPVLCGPLLDAWLRPAMAQFAHWLPALRARGGASLWIRLPAPLLAVPDLPARLLSALAAEGLDPSLLVLRVPLQVVGREARLPEVARELNAQGIVLAVDAFGAGTASLTHLDRLPVRTVCLAPSFVARAAVHTPQRWVVESTARLAQSMGMATLAEGVTQDHQVLALAAMGCTLGVGEVCGPWLDGEAWSRRWAGAMDAQAA